MAEKRKKIKGTRTTAQNRQLAELLTTVWLDKKVVKIEREPRADGEYWRLTHN